MVHVVALLTRYQELADEDSTLVAECCTLGDNGNMGMGQTQPNAISFQLG